MVDRFISYGKGILKEEAISALVERIKNIEKAKNVGEITSLLVRLKKQKEAKTQKSDLHPQKKAFMDSFDCLPGLEAIPNPVNPLGL